MYLNKLVLPVVALFLMVMASIAFSGCERSPRLGDPVRAVMHKGEAMQTIDIKVDHGYEPNNIIAKTGVPLVLMFGKSDGSCAKDIVIPDLNVSDTLSNEFETPITLTVNESKTVFFHCSMKMMHGQIEFKEEVLSPEEKQKLAEDQKKFDQVMGNSKQTDKETTEQAEAALKELGW